jgi:two-component system sensor histidine kinase HydH
MNLLKQTALILGLASLSIGGWTLYKNWRSKLAILFSALCFCVSVWALSFVSDVTLNGRLSRDVHWFFNLWLAPVGVAILSHMVSGDDRFGRILTGISLVGAAILSIMVSFSMGHSGTFWFLVSFWPTFILAEYVYVMIKDLLLKHPVSVDFISPNKRKVLYAGLGVSLAICSFDHIPFLGYTIPAFGNLLFAVYLAFASQVFTPQKLLGLEALLSRFFAILFFSLVITGFFALLYQYVSESFPLFLLNSFLVSFSLLVLWNPLVTFFRFLGREMFQSEGSLKRKQLDQFKIDLSTVTTLEDLIGLLRSYFEMWMQAVDTRILYEEKDLIIPEQIEEFFKGHQQQGVTPILHRELIKMERDQVMTSERKQKLDSLTSFLQQNHCDVIFPVFRGKQIAALVLASVQTSVDEWTVSLGFYSSIFTNLQEISNTLTRLSQIESEKEKDRLVLMGEMAAGLAHEVRNPLGAIRGAAELIDVSTPWAKVIQEEVNRLNRLVSQFLDFANSPKEKPEPMNLAELVQTSLKNLKPMLPDSIQVETEFANEAVWVNVVPDHIQQVLINLVQNAVKAVEGRANPKVVVQIFHYGFKVKDNGMGMSEETVSRIFQPFFTSFKNGTGLGLSICQRLVHFNGGRISVESRLGEGTEMTIELCAIK